jgi:hypothetical protein
MKRNHFVSTLCFLSCQRLGFAWNANANANNLPSNGNSNGNGNTRKEFIAGLVIAATTMTTTAGVVATSAPAWAVGDDAIITSTNTAGAAAADDDEEFQAQLQKSLRPATDERPAIALPDTFRNTTPNKNGSTGSSSSSSSPTTNTLPPPTTIQALIALTNPQIRPSPGDLLVIQVYSSSSSSNTNAGGGMSLSNNSNIDKQEQRLLLGGAKVPVARIRFPVQIQLTTQNAIDKSAWEQFASSQDLWIAARIVPGNSNDNNNDDSTSSSSSPPSLFEALGISKFLTSLPGLDSDTIQSLGQTGIRTPASLTLSVVK